MARRVSALSQVLKETQAAAGAGAGNPPAEPEPQNSIPVLPQNSKAEILENVNTAILESGNTGKLQNVNTGMQENSYSNTEISQNSNNVLPQKRRKTDDRTKLTFYLDPEDIQKFDALRYEYNVQHNQRLDQNKFMRLIVKHLDGSVIGTLLK